ncbi:MAG: iron ABC transporter permease [Candidatus Rokubacteria bacterium]|nr:iron ABC transporter permease [Candidatus Rokubacteria bacterium]
MRRGRLAGILLVLPLALFLAAFLLYPFLYLAAQSLVPGTGVLEGRTRLPGARGLGHWLEIVSWENYRKLFGDRYFLDSLLHSVLLSLSVAVGSAFLCLAPAWVLVRTEFPGKRLFRAILTIPMAFSGVIVGFMVVIMIGRWGMIPAFFYWLTGDAYLSMTAYGLSGLVVAYVYFEIPRATLTLEAAIRKFDFDLDAAARSLGASLWQRLWYILVPLLLPAIISTIAVTFAVSMGSFGVALIIAKKFNLLPVDIFLEIVGYANFEFASALCIVLGALTLGTNLYLRRIGERYYVFK